MNSSRADGFNGILAHPESAMSVVVLSANPLQVRRDFANSRAWLLRLTFHGGGPHIREPSVLEGEDNAPGALSRSLRSRKADDDGDPTPRA